MHRRHLRTAVLDARQVQRITQIAQQALVLSAVTSVPFSCKEWHMEALFCYK